MSADRVCLQRGLILCEIQQNNHQASATKAGSPFQKHSISVQRWHAPTAQLFCGNRVRRPHGRRCFCVPSSADITCRRHLIMHPLPTPTPLATPLLPPSRPFSIPPPSPPLCHPSLYYCLLFLLLSAPSRRDHAPPLSQLQVCSDACRVSFVHLARVPGGACAVGIYAKQRQTMCRQA